MDTQNHYGIEPITIEKELQDSYLTYAMSVIVSRALPDIRDGIKPVHRRILYVMHEMGVTHTTAFKKSGRVVGDTLGKYHPHGDQSIYDALVRLAQDFSLRYPIVEGQGNFGSIDGDPPAASRYTEVRMTELAELMVQDIEKETVAFKGNYDDSLQEPEILPGRFPFLLANGGTGIAVGMTTNIPSHNLREIADAIEAVIDDQTISTDALMNHISGPDFSTGGIIVGTKGIKEAYATGRGRIILRARTHREESRNKADIIVTEIPYQVNKSDLIRGIAHKVKNKKLIGIRNIRDESDRKGLRIVFETTKDANLDIVENQLLAHSELQRGYSIVNLALVNGLPKVLSLREQIQLFIDHRKQMITKRSVFELTKAKNRAHILEGYLTAIDVLDEIIKIIRAARAIADARENLIAQFAFTEKQAQAILELRLYRLSNLEILNVKKELADLKTKIADLDDLIKNEGRILTIVTEETRAIADRFGDARRTAILAEEISELEIEDLMQEENMLVTLSADGYIKRIPLRQLRAQSRGGKGVNSATHLHEGDYIKRLCEATTHDNVYFVTSQGRLFWVRCHFIQEGRREARGMHVASFVQLEEGEMITSLFAASPQDDTQSIVFATKKGKVKRMMLSLFKNAKKRKIAAIRLAEDDELIDIVLTHYPENDLFFVTKQGKALRCPGPQVKAVGRSAAGVKGIQLKPDDMLVSAHCVDSAQQIFLVSERGFGKRMEYDAFMAHARGTGGQRCFTTHPDKTGYLVAGISVSEEDHCTMVTQNGKMIRIPVTNVSTQGRMASGVRVLTLGKGDMIQSLSTANEL